MSAFKDRMVTELAAVCPVPAELQPVDLTPLFVETGGGSPNEQAQRIQRMAEAGLSDQSIADIEGIHIDELCELYESELASGHQDQGKRGNRS